MLLDASRSHGIGILVELRAKGHKGPPRARFEFEFEGSQEKLRAVKPSHPENIGESQDWLALSLKAPITSSVGGCVSFFASSPTAHVQPLGCPYPCPFRCEIHGPQHGNRKTNPEVCVRVLILPDDHDFAGSMRAGS